MHMRALVDISSTVGMIPKGSKFYELNPEQAQQLILLKMAESLDPEIKVPVAVPLLPTPLPEAGVEGAGSKTEVAPVGAPKVEEPKDLGPNSRGWKGLHWDGATAVIIGSGPSLTPEQTQAVYEWRNAKTDGSRRVIVINTSFRLAPWADVLYACDGSWWAAKPVGGGQTYFQEASKTFKPNQMWTQDKHAAQNLGIQYIRSVKDRGLSKNPAFIHQGNNSGFQATNIAYLAGVARIILLGFDMRGGHWHGDHPPPLSSGLPHITWINNFTPMATDLKAAGIQVLNATPKSALRCFPNVALEEALA